MVKYIPILFLLLFVSNAISQSTENEDSVYTQTEVMPEFPGGKEKLVHYVSQKLFMPINCSKDNLSSKINVVFIVNKEGQVSHVEFKDSIPCPEFENQIRKIFDEMPVWTPGWHNDKPVHVKMVFPLIIEFE
jgi:hypothetical protein